MVRTPPESKAKLWELVERASLADTSADRKSWIRRLRKFQRTYGRGRPKTTVDEILAETRENRF